MEYLQIALIVAAWIVLQKWVLPRLGVRTWMAPDACRVPTEKKLQTLSDTSEGETKSPTDP